MYIVPDKRSMVVVPTCHCVLNQSAKLEGIAGWPGVIREIVQVLIEHGVGILQIPCPEMIYEGIGRFDKSIEQYDCAAFQGLCQQITTQIFDQLENYIRWGYQVPVIIAIDGSPSCGYNLSQTAPEWRGKVAGMDWKEVRYQPSPGILMQHFEAELKKRDLDIPILGIPEIPELGSLQEVIERLNSILSTTGERR